MNGGGSQNSSFSTGGGTPSFSPSSSGGWQSPFSAGSSTSANTNPFFNMSMPQMQNTQQSSPNQGWAAFSPTFNYFSNLAAQGQKTNLTAQQDISQALAQQNAITANQPTSATLADANQAAGLPVGGMPSPTAQAPIISSQQNPSPVPATASYDAIMKNWLRTGVGSQPVNESNFNQLKGSGDFKYNSYNDYLLAHPSYA